MYLYNILVVLEVTAFKESVSNAVESKRLHCQLHPNKVYYEGIHMNVIHYIYTTCTRTFMCLYTCNEPDAY